MAALTFLLDACQIRREVLMARALQRMAVWESWLSPVPGSVLVGEDPGYDEDFQQMREEVNKLTGADTTLVCQLAEALLSKKAKDIRVATYYTWARLQRDGEAGLADGLELLAALLQRFSKQLHPQRERSRQSALAWLGGGRMLDTLSLYPQVVNDDALRTVGALLLIAQANKGDEGTTEPEIGALYHALASRLMRAGDVEAAAPPNAALAPGATAGPAAHLNTPGLTAIVSGQDLLQQARILAKYLRDQPDGWLSSHHLIKSIRYDTLHQLPQLSADGSSRLEPPKPDQRDLLKRLYRQQSWFELIEQADSLFARGANHLWLDLQWYVHRGLLALGRAVEATIIRNDLQGLLTRLKGLERLVFNDGTPFANEATLDWIQQQVIGKSGYGLQEPESAAKVLVDDTIVALETEALQVAESQGAEAALAWLQTRPGVVSVRQQWLLRLLMAQVAEQYDKKELAVHLLRELDVKATELTLRDWEPNLLFQARVRRLKLLRNKAGHSESDKTRLQAEMEDLLAGLIAIDPVQAAVLCH